MTADRDWSEADIASALEDADLRTLLTVLVHLTGDTRWIEPPFTPKRDVRLIPAPDAGLSPEVQAEIRAAALQVLARGGLKPVITDPGNELMQRMMSASTGEDVPPEYAPMVREEMGLVERLPEWHTPPSPEALAQMSVLIVGAGASGIALGATLGRLGIPYTIVEMRDRLGGAWYANQYPGCGVDTPNHSYSFSFGERFAWSRYFARREEVEAYLEGVAAEFDIPRHIRCNTKLVAARWDEARHRWISTLETASGREEVESTILVSAVGQLSDPSPVAFPGAERFTGAIFHPAEWPKDLDLTGKRLAIVGTGATSMQLVPATADRVAHVAVYQRTAQWVRPIPGYGQPIPDGQRWLLEHVPFFASWFRFNMFWRYGDSLLPFLRIDPDWEHPDRSVNRINDRHRQEMCDFIESELGDRDDLIAKCVPDYPPYGKRILLDNGWYRTLLKPNVELIETPIEKIVPEGVQTTDGRVRPADVIVLATGFKVTELAARLNITGRDGVTLAEAWADENPTAYLGLVVPGFPNFHCMIGPNSGPGHGGSVIFQAECQTRYIASVLVGMVEKGIDAVDVRRDVHDAYVRQVDEAHEQMIWSHPGMTTYYRNKHGRVFSVMPWRFVDYWAMTHDPDFADFAVSA